jgi:hypothetical protein
VKLSSPLPSVEHIGLVEHIRVGHLNRSVRPEDVVDAVDAVDAQHLVAQHSRNWPWLYLARLEKSFAPMESGDPKVFLRQRHLRGKR